MKVFNLYVWLCVSILSVCVTMCMFAICMSEYVYVCYMYMWLCVSILSVCVTVCKYFICMCDYMCVSYLRMWPCICMLSDYVCVCYRVSQKKCIQDCLSNISGFKHARRLRHISFLKFDLFIIILAMNILEGGGEYMLPSVCYMYKPHFCTT